MSVVVNGRFLRATPTGLHRTARSLLVALLDAGLEAEVAAPADVDDPLVDLRLPAPAGGRLGDHLWEQVSLPRHAGNRPVVSLANTAPLAAGRGVVLVHDLGPLVGPHWFSPSMQLYGGAVLAAARRAERVMTVSAQVAGELRAAGVDPARTTVVRPALDPSFGPAAPSGVAAARARLGLGDAPYFLFVGWADPRKDAGTAARAHLIANAAHPHVLVLVGLAHRNFRPVELPDAPTVLRPGYVGDGELKALLTGAAALVYPSRYEGFGLPPLEAWACGTPAIVGDTPALRESTEGRARYVTPGDVTELAAAMGEALAGKLAVPELPSWTWADAAAAFLAVVPRGP